MNKQHEHTQISDSVYSINSILKSNELKVQVKYTLVVNCINRECKAVSLPPEASRLFSIVVTLQRPS